MSTLSTADPRALLPETVRALSAYTLDLSPCRHKLDQNEVPWELPRRLRETIARRWLAGDWARYPDFHADALRAALGALHGWPRDGVLVGNGSNELLALTLAALAGGRELLALAPGFGLYPVFALAAGARWRAFGPRQDLRLAVDELEAAVAEDPRRPVLLCTPNNPTGEAIPAERVDALLTRLEAPLFLDNAYGEFSGHDYRPLLARHRHLLLFRTFSKAWSLAGMRLGYLLADPGLAGELLKLKLPYNVNQASALAGEVALAHPQAAGRRVRLLIGRRSAWSAMLARAGAEVFPSEANFVLTRWPGETAVRVRDGLAARGIRVRDLSRGAGLAGCLRVSVGCGAAWRDTRAALAEILADEGAGEGGAEDCAEGLERRGTR